MQMWSLGKQESRLGITNTQRAEMGVGAIVMGKDYNQPQGKVNRDPTRQ